MLHRTLLRELVDEPVGSSRGRCNPRAVKRAASKFPIRYRCKTPPSRPTITIRVVVT